ncbi:hypothetical protein N9260_00590 [bacterium]|nr:hypothetical protein [bacterium]
MWAAAAGLLVLVLVIVWVAAKPMGESPPPLGVVSGPPQPYWSEVDIAEQRDRLMQRLEEVPEPVGVSVNEIVARYDRGLDVVFSESKGKLSWGEEGAVPLVQRFLQSPKAEGEASWFDETVDYLQEGAVPRERVQEVLKNVQSIWPERWQYLQEPPTAKRTEEGLIEVRVCYVHLALNARRLRKWTLRQCYGVKEGPDGAPVISGCHDEEKDILLLTEAERHFLLMHFCEKYYLAGCANNEMSQLHFLSDPTFYIDADKSLTEISQSFEHYHLIRPNRELVLLAMPEVERLNEDLYLVACRFSASRGEEEVPAKVTDIIQILFVDDEPHLV